MSIYQQHIRSAMVAVALACMTTASFGQANVDLNTWSEVTTTNANWNVAGDGSSVLQTVNGAPTIFLSPNNFINTVVEGAFRVTTNTDNDFIGFVFGLTDPTTPGTTIDALLLDWKRANQDGASLGFRLSYVTGDIVNSGAVSNPYWTHTTTANTTFQSLGTNTGTGLGWLSNTDYNFTLDYSPTDIVITIEGGTGLFQNGLEVFNVNINDPAAQAAFPGGAFPDGRFGFYNFSQASVQYEGFTQTDDPILGTVPDDGQTLNFGNVRVTGSADAQLNVANQGGVGSTLTGDVGLPVNPVFTLNTAPNTFALGEGEDTDFEFSFNPTTRGLSSETINVSSNDPADTDGHDILLSGTGVGPVYNAAASINFLDVDADDNTMLLLTIANITTDGDLGGLTDLTLNNFALTGDDAGMFSLLNFTPGQTIAAGDTFDLQIQFAGDSTLGDFAALLTLFTDEGVALGAAGSEYQIDLNATAIPEPATVALLGLGGLIMLRRRRTAIIA